jgi:hypothetical protein
MERDNKKVKNINIKTENKRVIFSTGVHQKVFVADKLSETNKRQLNSLGVEWVELRNHKGF